MRQLDLFSPDQETFRHGYRLIERLQVVEDVLFFNPGLRERLRHAPSEGVGRS